MEMTITKIARGYIGETEKPKNSGFSNEALESKMKGVGWSPGEPWCSYLAELIFKEALPKKANLLDALFSSNSYRTFENFIKAGYIVYHLPMEGTLVLWAKYKGGEPVKSGNWTLGHTGICVEAHRDRNLFQSVEGNTNDGGGREGYIVHEHTRRLSYCAEDGLRLLGFVELRDLNVTI